MGQSFFIYFLVIEEEVGWDGMGKDADQTVVVILRGVGGNIPKRNDISALVPTPDHDRPVIKKDDVSWARQIGIQRWLC